MPLEQPSADLLECAAGHSFPRRGGIWRLVTAEDEARFRAFVSHYERVRREEERGGDDAAYYRALPFRDLTGAHKYEWRIRARSFRTLLESTLAPKEGSAEGPLRIVDLGAGSGWLSYRLALRGHLVTAVDLQTNRRDGLGAHVHYDAPFLPVQAHFGRLPFRDGVFDLAIFNASLHYASSGREAIAEALRVLAPEGIIAVLDSPLYDDEADGAAMAAANAARFSGSRAGSTHDSSPLPDSKARGAILSRPYLTFTQIAFLGALHHVLWDVHRPSYGLRWTLRPWIARLLRRRVPARFAVLVGRKTTSDGAIQPPLPRPPIPLWLMPAWHFVLRRRFRYFQRHRHNQLVVEKVAGRSLIVLPGVFNPALFHSSELLASSLSRELISPGSTVLDMGTGSGVGAITAATWAAQVDAVDVNPTAVRCAGMNALMHRVEERIAVLVGDLFAPIEGRRYDVILFNPPYYRGHPADALDAAFRATDVVERFAAGLAEHLTSTGCALVVLSTEGDAMAFLRTLFEQGFYTTPLRSRRLPGEVLTLYVVARNAS